MECAREKLMTAEEQRTAEKGNPGFSQLSSASPLSSAYLYFSTEAGFLCALCDLCGWQSVFWG
jgi:hypothetical protein